MSETTNSPSQGGDITSAGELAQRREQKEFQLAGELGAATTREQIRTHHEGLEKQRVDSPKLGQAPTPTGK